MAGLGRMGNAIGFRSRSCARTRRRQAHDYRRRAWLLRAGEIGSVEKSCGLPISHQTSHELARSDENAESVLPSITDSGEMLWRVRFVPLPDSCNAANKPHLQSPFHKRGRAILRGRRLLWKVSRLDLLNKRLISSDAACHFSVLFEKRIVAFKAPEFRP